MEGHPLAHARGESMQAPTTNLSSNDPWRDPESPQTPETSRHVLERKKPHTATKTAPDLAHGPAYTRKTGTQSLDRQIRQTGTTPPRHPDHAGSGNAGACQTGIRTSMGSAV